MGHPRRFPSSEDDEDDIDDIDGSDNAPPSIILPSSDARRLGIEMLVNLEAPALLTRLIPPSATQSSMGKSTAHSTVTVPQKEKWTAKNASWGRDSGGCPTANYLGDLRASDATFNLVLYLKLQHVSLNWTLGSNGNAGLINTQFIKVPQKWANTSVFPCVVGKLGECFFSAIA
ncbi:hypothetical protein C8R45DRAFT_944849 [Mycena sanguinolenta]|nr:hypothetical protein C8R45DRAFT_944849 [Mycena sanguinolenta]